MEEYLRKLSAYIAEAGGDSEGVQQAYDSLHNQLQGLQPQHADTILNTVSDLCWEHDRQGFTNGFKMGMRLEQELSQ